MKLTKEKAKLVEKLKNKLGDIVSRQDVLAVTRRSKMPRWLFNTKTYRAKERGHYDLTKVEKSAAA